MVLEPVCCPDCGSEDVVKNGKSSEGKQRYLCRHRDCHRRSFIRNYSYRGYLPAIKQQIADMAVNGSGIRDTARVLKISPTTVIEELKKTSPPPICKQKAISSTEPPRGQGAAVAGKRSRSRT